MFLGGMGPAVVRGRFANAAVRQEHVTDVGAALLASRSAPALVIVGLTDLEPGAGLAPGGPRAFPRSLGVVVVGLVGGVGPLPSPTAIVLVLLALVRAAAVTVLVFIALAGVLVGSALALKLRMMLLPCVGFVVECVVEAFRPRFFVAGPRVVVSFEANGFLNLDDVG